MIRDLVREIADEALVNMKKVYDSDELHGPGNDNMASARDYLINTEKQLGLEFKRMLAETMCKYKEEADTLSRRLSSGEQYQIRKEEAERRTIEDTRQLLLSIGILLFFCLITMFYFVVRLIGNDSSFLSIAIISMCILAVVIFITICMRHSELDAEEIARMASREIEKDTKRKEDLYLICNVIIKYIKIMPVIEEPEEAFDYDLLVMTDKTKPK